ncbi:phage antirepressor [Bacteroides sp.]|uniref:phage antirepressor n=1 Tax=Bacteroides sp. TaxID=29523 RepID=UPI0025C1972E|nr:phage antirepressor KilAC domain-containing protein [Bacteroides sp.]
MNELRIFQNTQFGNVRVAISEKSEPMFVGVDVATVLGYKNPQEAIRDHVDEEDRGYCKLSDIQGVSETLPPHMKAANLLTINESGVYSLIMRSNLPTAKQFKRWVTSEVLPSIRKHGAYMTGETLAQMLQNPDRLIDLLTALKSERERNTALSLNIEAMQPKATYFDTVLSSSSLITTNTIAAKLGISAQRLNKFLCESGIQYKQGGLYFLYSDLRGKGLEGYQTFARADPDTGETKTAKHMYWTEKGAFFIINLYQGTTYKLLN